MKKYAVKKTEEITVQTLARIKAIFDFKGWPLEGCFGESYFDEFCGLIQSLDAQESDIILALTNDFIWIRDFEYSKYFAIVFEQFVSTVAENRYKNIYIAPLLSESDFGKPKSSVVLFYYIKSHLLYMQNKYNQYNIIIEDSPKTFNSSKFSESSILCLIDDFIGSGDTGDAAAQFFVNKKGMTKDMVAILSLVAMQQGIDYLHKTGYTVLAAKIMQKGITGRTDGNEKNFREVMETIENRIKVRDDFKFGYAGSEALIRMVRTPNNTFPVYWLKNKKNPHAPFPR